MGGTGTNLNLSLVTVNGDVGVGIGGIISNMAPSTVTGNAYVSTSSSQYTGPGTLGGSVIVDTPPNAGKVTTDIQLALNASVNNAALPADQTSGSVTSATTFTATHNGQNVIDINGDINLNNLNLTLSAGSFSNVSFVVNVTGSLTLTGSASLNLNGLSQFNALYNFDQYALQVGMGQTPGAGTSGSFNTHVDEVVNGIMLAPNYTMNLDGTFNGELIGGPMTIGLLSNASVNGPTVTPAVPEPSSAVVARFVALLGLGWAGVRRVRHRSV